MLLAFSLVFLNRTPGHRKRLRIELATTSPNHARTQLDHRSPARRAARVRRDLGLPGAQRALDLAAAGQPAAVHRPVDHSRTTGRSHSYVELFTEQPFLRWLGNSLLVATLVTVTGVALASIGGYAFSRFRFVGRKATMLAILTTQMFPATMLLLPLYILIARLHLRRTRTSA